MDAKAIEAARKAAQDTADRLGYQLYGVKLYREGSTQFLEVMVDKDYQVTLDQIEAYSNALSDALDAVVELDEPYTLDVSSPGLEREFPKGDLAKVTGRYVEVDTAGENEGKSRGEIASFDGKTLVLKSFIKGRRKMTEIDLADIVSCRFAIKS